VCRSGKNLIYILIRTRERAQHTHTQFLSLWYIPYVRLVGSRAPYRMFVVVLEKAAAGSWHGQDQDRRCTGRNEERCCTGLNEEWCDLYWAAIGPGRLGGRDVNTLAVGGTSGLAESHSFSMWASSHLLVV
jgi:hypothetical protein